MKGASLEQVKEYLHTQEDLPRILCCWGAPHVPASMLRYKTLNRLYRIFSGIDAFFYLMVPCFKSRKAELIPLLHSVER